MKFKPSEWPVYNFEHKFYNLYFRAKHENMDEAVKYMNTLNLNMRRWLDGSGNSFLLGVSVIDSKKPIGWQTEKTGRPGRPKIKVQGQVKKPHIHAIMYGHDVSKNAKMVCEMLKKKSGKPIAYNGKGTSGYASYIISQCKGNIRTFGDFDFMKLSGGEYIEAW